jgi:hypothetical protein
MVKNLLRNRAKGPVRENRLQKCVPERERGPIYHCLQMINEAQIKPDSRKVECDTESRNKNIKVWNDVKTVQKTGTT